MADDAARQALLAALVHSPEIEATTLDLTDCQRLTDRLITAVRPRIAWDMMQEILADLRAARDDAQRLAGKLSGLGADIGGVALRAGATLPPTEGTESADV